MAIDKSLLHGKTRKQKKAVKYFIATGYLSGRVSDGKYDSMVLAKLDSLNVRESAIQKIGVDESLLNELPPVNFHGYEFDGAYSLYGNDGRPRSSKYSSTWLFFGKAQVYMYNITFDMCSDNRSERTEEYFYKDIVGFSTSSNSVEVIISCGCFGKKNAKKQVTTSKFAIVVPGDKFCCSTTSVPDADNIIRIMKQKLREKKS